MKTHDILNAAAKHMEERAATYDKPEGERSMGATVKAFEAVTGHQLTEEQGWLFMALLKAVRSQQGALRMDSYEDGAAYFALAGEAAARDRARPVIHEPDSGGWAPEAISGAAFKQDGHELYSEEDVVGINGNDGAHSWRINSGAIPPLKRDTRVMVEFRNGDRGPGAAGGFRWDLSESDYDIIRWRLA